MPFRPSRYSTFDDFWPYYVSQHRTVACRALHYVAAAVAATSVALAVIAWDWRWLALAPVAGYGIAWLGHFLIERNAPATWRYVRWSLRAEFKMLTYALTGRMRDEVERLCSSSAPADP